MRKKTKNRNKAPAPPHKEDQKLPFIEHLYELRRRLFFVAISVVVFSTFAYFIQQKLVAFLLKPAHGQQFIYTTPGGGLNFLFQVCIYFGITLSIPVLIYQMLRYIEPLVHRHNRRAIARYSVVSWLLAIGGAAFGYYVGLPVALNFLAHQFTTSQIKPLLTIQEYMSFVTIYLMGSALLFQIPLILMFINRIKPLSPQKLLGFERYFILIAFVAAAIMTPTPDIMNQMMFAGPIIAVYQVGILLVFIKNRKVKSYANEPAPARAERRPADLPNPFLQSAVPLPHRPSPAQAPRPIAVSRRATIRGPGVWDVA